MMLEIILVTLVAILILIVFIVMGVLLYNIYNENINLKKVVEGKSVVELRVGKVDPYTQNHEKILLGNKEALECMSVLLLHKFGLSNDKLHNKNISQDDFRYVQGQCDAYLNLKISIDNLIKKNK